MSISVSSVGPLFRSEGKGVGGSRGSFVNLRGISEMLAPKNEAANQVAAVRAWKLVGLWKLPTLVHEDCN